MQVLPPLQIMKAHKGGIWSICASLPGCLITGGDDGLLKSWEVEEGTGRLLLRAEAVTPHSEVLLVRQTAPGALLSAGHDGGVVTWELEPVSGRLIQRQQLLLSDERRHYNDRLLETHSGHLLAWASGTAGHPALCRWSEKERTFFFHQELPIERAICFLEMPSGELLAGDHAGRVSCWRRDAASDVWYEDGVLQAHEGPIHVLSLARGGTWVSAGGDEPLLKVWAGSWGAGGCRLQQVLQGHRSRILEVVEAGSGELLSADQGERSLAGWRHRPELLVWRKSAEGFHLVQRMTGRMRRCVDGMVVMEGDGVASLSIWSRVGESYERLAVLDEGMLRNLSAIEPLNGRMLIAGGLDGRLVSWRPSRALARQRSLGC